MKKTIFIFFPMFLLFSATLLFSQANKLKVIVSRGYIYTDASINSSIVEVVEKGTILNQISPEKIRFAWYRVSFYSQERSNVIVGFIQASAVEIMSGAPKKAQQQKQKPKTTPERRSLISVPPGDKFVPRPYVPRRFKLGPQSGVGLLAGYAMPAVSNFGSSVKYGGNLSLGITKNVTLELKGLTFQSAVEGDPVALSKGKLSVMPIQVSIQAKFPVSNRLLPYLLGGGGYYVNKFILDQEIVDAWDALGFNIEEKVENAIGFHLGAGIDFFFTKNVALNVDARYCLAKIKGSWILTDQIMGAETSGDLEGLNLNSLIFGGGLKFYF